MTGLKVFGIRKTPNGALVVGNRKSMGCFFLAPFCKLAFCKPISDDDDEQPPVSDEVAHEVEQQSHCWGKDNYQRQTDSGSD